MPSPKSPITLLAGLLNATTQLKGFAKVLAGKNQLASGRAPPSIVILPVAAGYSAASDNVDSFADVDLKVAARLWGRDLDEVWDLRARYVAALREQATGNPLDPNDTAAGFFYQLVDETWDTAPDTAQQGQEMEVIASFRLSASDATVVYGLVLAESFLRTAALTADMTAIDTTATVDSTVELPTSGVLHIDGEMISYSGTTPTSFTGLVRGINGTTAAIHLSAATVSLSPT